MRTMVVWSGTGVGTHATTRASGPACVREVFGDAGTGGIASMGVLVRYRQASGTSAGGIAGTGVRGAVRQGKRAGTPRMSAKKHAVKGEVNGGGEARKEALTEQRGVLRS
jgi:hypothetical protein